MARRMTGNGIAAPPYDRFCKLDRSWLRELGMIDELLHHRRHDEGVRDAARARPRSSHARRLELRAAATSVRPVNIVVIMLVAPAMWYSGTHSSAAPRGVPSASSTLAVT